MRTCPNCQAELASEFAARCDSCGSLLEDAMQTKRVGPPLDDDDDLEFQVQEKEETDTEFVGGTNDFEPGEKNPNEDKPTVSSADSEDDLKAESDFSTSGSMGDTDFEPIGHSSPFLPEDDEPPPAPEPDDTDFSDLKPEEPPEEDPELTDSGRLKKLSDEEVQSISTKMYRNESYLSEDDKKALINKLENQDQLFANNQPIVPPKKANKRPLAPKEVAAEIDESKPAPKMAHRSKGVAFYYKNLIQLRGSQHIMPGDEMILNDRYYELQPKKLNRNSTLIAAGLVFVAVLVFVGSLMISDTGGDGRIVGVVLNEYDQPILEGGTVHFPDLGKTYEVNAQGLFQSESMPVGAHKIEFIRDGKTFSVDYATVVREGISMVVLRPSDGDEMAAAPPEREKSPPKEQPKPQPAPKEQIERESLAETSSSPSQPSPGRRTNPSPRPTTAKLALAANVDGARLKLGGEVLGAGNLTYNKLDPGSYKYEVSRDGYAPVSGTIRLEAGRTERLTVTLKPLLKETKQQEYTSEDFYFSGLSAVQEQDYKAAVADLNQALKMDPGNADAYHTLGLAWAGIKDWPKARDAFLNAARIYRKNGNGNRAVTSYTEAIGADDKSVEAYLGRGDLFLNRGDARAALIDFETVTRIDRRSAEAYLGMGEARLKQNMFDKAIDHLEDARSLDGDNPIIHQYLMLAYMAEQEYDDVKRSYTKFTETASERQIDRVESDQRYAAVLRLIETDR